MPENKKPLASVDCPDCKHDKLPGMFTASKAYGSEGVYIILKCNRCKAVALRFRLADAMPVIYK